VKKRSRRRRSNCCGLACSSGTDRGCVRSSPRGCGPGSGSGDANGRGRDRPRSSRGSRRSSTGRPYRAGAETYAAEQDGRGRGNESMGLGVDMVSVIAFSFAYRRTHLRSEPLPRMSKCVRQRLGHLPPHVRDPRLAVVSTCSRGIGDHSRWPHLWAHSRNSWCWLPGASRLRQVRIRYAVTFARTVRLATTSGAHLLRDRDHLPEREVGATERSALALGGPRLRTYPPPGRRRVPSGHPQGAATVRVWLSPSQTAGTGSVSHWSSPSTARPRSPSPPLRARAGAAIAIATRTPPKNH